MKRAVILHAMEQDSSGHWYPWLKSQLEDRGFEVWVPDLPTTDEPDAEEMTKFLQARKDWDWKDNLIIGHSSGAVEILHVLPELAEGVNAAIYIGSFDHALWEEAHKKLFHKPFNFAAVTAQANHHIFIHGDDDPWCPIEGAHHLADETDGELIIIHGGGHFSTSLDPSYKEFPKLIEILNERRLL